MSTRRALAAVVEYFTLAVGSAMVVTLLLAYYLLSEEAPGWLTDDDAAREVKW